ncbi:hypothetical protein DVH05_024029 [Phytophthora capsici]|nr:hypothetical protein DVH05_024029 [Phytophthora capsici]
MPRSTVLLFPCDAPSASLEGPHYGEVLSRTAGNVSRVKLLAKPGTTTTVRVGMSSEIVAMRTVPPTELEDGAPGWLLFRPVTFWQNGQAFHGQITSYADGKYAVETSTGVTSVPYDEVQEVAPVLAFLLWEAKLLPAFTSVEKLDDAHELLLDRLLGQHGARATRNTKRLLSGVAVPATVPHPSTERAWVSPYTGKRVRTSVGHVIDFAFYNDGNRRKPPSVLISDTFCGDSPYQDSDAAGVGVPTLARPERATQVEDDLHEEADEEAEAGFADLLNEYAEAEHPPKRQKTSELHSGDNPFQDKTTRAILQTLASKPQLLSLYLDQLQGMHERSSPSACSQHRGERAPDMMSDTHHPDHGQRLHGGLTTHPVRSPLDRVSDLVDLDDNSSRHGRFRPTRAQQDVHNAITAVPYAGKTPDSFFDHARNSRATKFLPHPAVVSRLYDFHFGPCSLLILHFVRFSFQAQLGESDKKTVNLQNFSPTLNLPEPRQNPQFSDLVDALSVLDSYSSEFCEDITRKFVAEAKHFCEELKDLAPWSILEVKGLAFWFGKVFGAYRLAVVDDLASGGTARLSMKDRFTIQDGELNGILMKLSRTSKASSHDQQPAEIVPQASSNHSDRHTLQRKHKKVPQEVLRHVPRKNGLQLCLKSISKQGCPSTSPDTCTQPFLGHFLPPTLHPGVRSYVRERFGGLSTKYEGN